MIKRKLLPTIEKVDLLTVEEAGRLPLRLRKLVRTNANRVMGDAVPCWWLSSFGYSPNRACFVDENGCVDHCGNIVDIFAHCIRPALRITNLNDYRVGSIFKFGDRWFEIIDENTAFCTRDIGRHRFDYALNDYEKSEIKALVEEWYECARLPKLVCINR